MLGEDLLDKLWQRAMTKEMKTKRTRRRRHGGGGRAVLVDVHAKKSGTTGRQVV